MLSYVHQAITKNLPDLDRDLIKISTYVEKYFLHKSLLCKQRVSDILKQGRNIFLFDVK